MTTTITTAPEPVRLHECETTCPAGLGDDDLDLDRGDLDPAPGRRVSSRSARTTAGRSS